jgi:hypothetical protein
MPRSRDELVPIFNFGCRLWLRGIMAFWLRRWWRVNVSEGIFRESCGGVISGRFGGVNSGRFGGVEFGVKWDRFIHWLVDRFLAYLFPDLCGVLPRDPPECAKIPPRVHQKWPPKTPLFSPFFPNFPPKTGVSDSDISDFGHFPRFLGHNSTQMVARLREYTTFPLNISRIYPLFSSFLPLFPIPWSKCHDSP